MTVQTDAGALVANWRFQAGQYNALTSQLLDLSSKGHHLDKQAGAPNFGTFGGKLGLEVTGLNYFGRNPDFLPPSFTVVMPVYFNGLPTGGVTGIDLFRAELRATASNDPAWQTPTQDLWWENGNQLAPWLYAKGDFNIVYGGMIAASPTTNYTDAAWNVLQLVFNAEAMTVRVRVGNGAWSQSNVSNGQLPAMLDAMRMFYRATGTVGSGKCAVSQCLIYSGDAPALKPTEYAALITALVASADA